LTPTWQTSIWLGNWHKRSRVASQGSAILKRRHQLHRRRLRDEQLQLPRRQRARRPEYRARLPAAACAQAHPLLGAERVAAAAADLLQAIRVPKDQVSGRGGGARRVRGRGHSAPRQYLRRVRPLSVPLCEWLAARSHFDPAVESWRDDHQDAGAPEQCGRWCHEDLAQ